MKRVAIKVLGADKDPVDIVISPGVTAQDILMRMGLEHAVLARMGERNYFHPEEAIYDTLKDGDMVYAFTVCTIGHCAG